MANSDVATIDLLTEMDLALPERAREFLDLVRTEAEEFLPERFGPYEPLKFKLNIDGDAAFVAAWGQHTSLYWSSRRAKGSVHHPPYPQHESLTLYYKYTGKVGARLVRLFDRLTAAFRPDIAGLHVYTPAQTGGMSVFGRTDAPGFSMHTFSLLKGLPPLWWRTHFGKPYVDMFGEEKLKSLTSVASVSVGAGAATVQLTSNIHDCSSDVAEVERVRTEVKAQLGSGYFAPPEGPPVAIRLLEPPMEDDDLSEPVPVARVPDFPDVPEWLRDRELRAEMTSRGEPVPLMPRKPRPY